VNSSGNRPPDDPPDDGPDVDPYIGDLQARIGRRLRAHYADILSQPIPDRITALLDRLAETDGPGLHPPSSDRPLPTRADPAADDETC
jgi:hypothetical protein